MECNTKLFECFAASLGKGHGKNRSQWIIETNVGTLGTFTMECFSKIANAYLTVNYFCKKVDHRYLPRS